MGMETSALIRTTLFVRKTIGNFSYTDTVSIAVSDDIYCVGFMRETHHINNRGYIFVE